MQFMTGQVGKHKDDLKKNASTDNVSKALDTFSMKLHQDWANKSFSEENAMRVANTRQSALQQAGQMLNILRDTPENKDAIWVNYKQTIENCKGILPASDYNKFEKKLTEDFDANVILGHVSKDPYNAMALLNSKEHTSNLSAEKRQSLQRFVASSIKSLEKRERQAEKVAEADLKNRANIEETELKIQLVKGTLTEQDIVGSQYLSEVQRNKLMARLVQKDKATLKAQDNYALVCKHAETDTETGLTNEQLNKAFEYELSILSGQNGEPTANVYAIQGAKYHTNLNKYCKKIENAFKYGGATEVVEAVGAFRVSQGLRAENISSINTESYNAFATMVEASFNPNDPKSHTYENIKRYRQIIFEKNRTGLTDDQRETIKKFDAESKAKAMFDQNFWFWQSVEVGGNDIHKASVFLRNKLAEGMRLGLSSSDAETFAKAEVQRMSSTSALNDGHLMFMAPEVTGNLSPEYVKNITALAINTCTKNQPDLVFKPDRIKDWTKQNINIKDCTTPDYNVVYFKTKGVSQANVDVSGHIGSSKETLKATVVGEHLNGSRYNLYYIHPTTKQKVYLKDPNKQFLTNKVVEYGGL